MRQQICPPNTKANANGNKNELYITCVVTVISNLLIITYYVMSINDVLTRIGLKTVNFDCC